MRVCSSYPINCTYNNEECRLDENRDYYTTTCDSANSFRYAFDYREKTATIKISPFVTEVYLEGLVLDDKYYPPNKLSLRQLFLVSEQTMVVYYTITISKRIVSDYAYGLAGGEGIEFVEFNAHTVPVATLITPNATTLILMPISTDIYYQEETYYDIGSIISNIGGFFSSLSGFFIFLFGATKLAPWGILPTHVFNCLCTKYQRKLIRKLKNKYEPIPFVSGRTKNVTLEERVQVDDNKIDDKV
ncbi:hypothetical protein RclHR1_09500003 [Rhizophagus clarus]|uniref:Uncharacterized protein n=1 Tax=Rhizophagus clarus TaxID=94130 RepID=A0A2Z6SEW5_9GLOM|nr:hypothetical protein RclHR1_09500003 [Rhizophagus clarus]